MLIINLKDNLEFRWQVCINALETWNFVVSFIGLGTSFAGTNEHGPLLVRIYSTTSFDLCWQVLIARFIKPLKAIYKVLLYKLFFTECTLKFIYSWDTAKVCTYVCI